MAFIPTTCSGCSETVKVNRIQGVVLATKAGNGLRGSKRVETAKVSIDSDDGDLVTWDCPLCGYADSLDLNA